MIASANVPRKSLVRTQFVCLFTIFLFPSSELLSAPRVGSHSFIIDNQLTENKTIHYTQVKAN